MLAHVVSRRRPLAPLPTPDSLVLAVNEALLVLDNVVMLQAAKNVDLGDNLLAITVRHAVKLEFFSGKDAPITVPLDLANEAKGARPNHLEWFICARRDQCQRLLLPSQLQEGCDSHPSRTEAAEFCGSLREVMTTEGGREKGKGALGGGRE